MTKYKVNGGDKSERGDEVISPEVERNPLRDERERGMDTYGNVGSHPGTQLGVRICDPNTTTCLMHASLLISLLATFVVMLGKQWLNRYLRNLSGLMIEHCGDYQRRCDVLKKWLLHFFIESLPLML